MKILKRKLELVRKHISNQAYAIFGKERRTDNNNRKFLDSVYEDIREVYPDRQMVMFVATYMIRRLNKIKNLENGIQILFSVLQDKPN